MAAPVLVRAYAGDNSSPYGTSSARGGGARALPPVSSYTFAEILRASDCQDFQQAINGIAEICAKNHMSLADEYSSHLPPLGEITATNSAAVRPHLLRPGMRTALTSVPEASSGSSEGSHKSRKRSSRVFGFRQKEDMQSESMRKMRIGSMGRTVPVNGTTAMAGSLSFPRELGNRTQKAVGDDEEEERQRPAMERTSSEAFSSLQRILSQSRRTHEPDS